MRSDHVAAVPEALAVMPEKQFKIPGSEIKPLAEGHGGCFATDMITVDGQKVGYMYREKPDFPRIADGGSFPGRRVKPTWKMLAIPRSTM